MMFKKLLMSGALLFALSGAGGCCPPDDGSNPTPFGADVDEDGAYDSTGDCDDGATCGGDPECLAIAATVYPGANEIPGDGIDQNCNGLADEAPTTDNDGDGSLAADDCNDCDSQVGENFVETCDDDKDNNCNGLVDEYCDGEVGYFPYSNCRYGIDWRRVNDAFGGRVPAIKAVAASCEDGTPTPTATATATENTTPTATPTPEPVTPTPINPTEPPTTPEPTPCEDEDGDGLSLCQGDCDDNDSTVNLGKPEVCDGKDNNCDTQIDEGFDQDGDGYTTCETPADCDDANGSIRPGVSDFPYDGVDQNCDGEDLTDVDGDGFNGAEVGGEDCDDGDPGISPIATETCDRIDNNCDGEKDEGFDEDLDGFYSKQACPAFGDDCNDNDITIYPSALESCTDTVDKNCDGSIGFDDDDGDGFAACEECNDSASWVHPGAEEACNFMDDDCDGEVDEGVTTISYRDVDGDGHGNTETTYEGCGSPPSGYVAVGDDCNDTNNTIYPGATERCDGIDNNCNGEVPAVEVDSDLDGVRVCAGDCNDGNAAINPNATETCNHIDDDCDGLVDDDDSVQGVQSYYQDADGDTYGDPNEDVLQCFAPEGYVSDNTDCNDDNADVNRGKTEVTCDGVDNDCRSQTDDSPDADGDTYDTCPTGVTGADNKAVDCNDSAASVNPGRTEVCNGIDDNCSGAPDEGVTTNYYTDGDADGYGTGLPTVACTKPSGTTTATGDCDDNNPNVSPGKTEACNGVDDDCDGTADDGLTKRTYFVDADGDNYGNASSSTQACSAPAGYVSNNGDCNDSAALVNPGATEVCNGIDDDCDSTIDGADAVDSETYFKDTDGDGYGVSGTTTVACTKPTGYAALSGDCNDGNAAVNPGKPEVCNGIDDNCNSTVDEGVKTTFYRDIDEDGYGGTTSQAACNAPSGYVATGGDCDDNNETTHPGATEHCDGVDNNCAGGVDDNVQQPYSLDFVEGTDDVQVQNLPVSGAFTYETWVTWRAGWWGLLFTQVSSTQDVQLGLNGDGSIIATYRQAGSGNPYRDFVTGPNVIPTNRFHLALVLDATSFRLYINGQRIAENTQVTPAATGPAELWLGNNPAKALQAPGVIMEEFRVSSVARYTGASFSSPSKVGYDSSTTALWLFDEPSGNTAFDFGGQYHGTLHGPDRVAATCPSP